MISTEPTIEWIRPPSAAERGVLDRWAEAVGPPVVRGPAVACERPVDEVAFAVWNTNVGAGDLESLIAALQQGELTDGRGVEHFVLLLQEVHRGGAGVPPRPPPASLGASHIRGRPRRGPRVGIDVVAERAGLALYYVPSMRNGGSSPDAPAEDRGNAILSTLPLTALRAHELPLERQRRVAISATVRGTSRRGARFSMDWVNVHLDPRSARRRFHRSFGSGRARQIEWLLGTMAPETPALVGGDFNTWTRGARESAVRRLRSRFGVPTTANRGTLAVSRFLPSLRLDHVFWRLPHAWRSDCRILESTYGSDHRALVGRIRIDSATSQP